MTDFSTGGGQPLHGQPPPAWGQLPPGAARPLSMRNRVLGFVIDGAILYVIGLVAAGILVFGILGATSSLDCSNYRYDSTTGDSVGSCTGGAGAGIGIVVAFLVFLLIWISALVFWVYRLGRTGQTPGKKIMGVKVVDNDTGAPIGFGRAILRYVVQAACNVVCYAGLWSAFLDGPPQGRYRGWHDKAVNTVVISVK